MAFKKYRVNLKNDEKWQKKSHLKSDKVEHVLRYHFIIF